MGHADPLSPHREQSPNEGEPGRAAPLLKGKDTGTHLARPRLTRAKIAGPIDSSQTGGPRREKARTGTDRQTVTARLLAFCTLLWCEGVDPRRLLPQHRFPPDVGLRDLWLNTAAPVPHRLPAAVPSTGTR
ncbi:hypothetical protein SKAU_G00043960 [Synaphobranchus kaupii]|uniref:Uncharacterized protein n=1 Tax=Synaphobranchus kaupii TaxID=118154 RepID=A0A9Q1J806_SYNKA|nr:hypothetical protein SKAU_G00043960 [Synaphobranchus kaupii]